MCISGQPNIRHKLNHQIKPPSSLPSSSLGTPPPHSKPESSHFPASLWPWRPCEGLSWPQKEPPGIQAPQTPAQLGKGRAEERKQTVSSTLWRERGQVKAGGVLEDISGFCLCPQQPHSPASFLPALSLKPRIGGISPFLSSQHPQLPASGYPPKMAALSGAEWLAAGRGAGSPGWLPFAPLSWVGEPQEVCCGPHSPYDTART